MYQHLHHQYFLIIQQILFERVMVLQDDKIMKNQELTNTQLNKFKSAAQKKTGTTLRRTKKNF